VHRSDEAIRPPHLPPSAGPANDEAITLFIGPIPDPYVIAFDLQEHIAKRQDGRMHQLSILIGPRADPLRHGAGGLHDDPELRELVERAPIRAVTGNLRTILPPHGQAINLLILIRPHQQILDVDVILRHALTLTQLTLAEAIVSQSWRTDRNPVGKKESVQPVQPLEIKQKRLDTAKPLFSLALSNLSNLSNLFRRFWISPRERGTVG
jgi:hypothetical protein